MLQAIARAKVPPPKGVPGRTMIRSISNESAAPTPRLKVTSSDRRGLLSNRFPTDGRAARMPENHQGGSFGLRWGRTSSPPAPNPTWIGDRERAFHFSRPAGAGSGLKPDSSRPALSPTSRGGRRTCRSPWTTMKDRKGGDFKHENDRSRQGPQDFSAWASRGAEAGAPALVCIPLTANQPKGRTPPGSPSPAAPRISGSGRAGKTENQRGSALATSPSRRRRAEPSTMGFGEREPGAPLWG